MGNSLFDQLNKQGLVDKNKAQSVKREKYKSKKQKGKKHSAGELDEAKQLVQKAQQEKIERDRQLNLQRQEEAERKAIAAQIKQLIESNRIEERDGDVAYNFTDGNLVKHIHVSEKIHKHLTSGQLAIAKLGELYELVPAPVAQKIQQRDPSCVILAKNSTDHVQDDDDPYADYTIPDDLMW